MQTVIFVSWILAYSFCLLHLGLSWMLYYRTKIKGVLCFWLILLNMVVVTIVLMVTMFAMNFGPFFFRILVNCVATYQLSVPLYIYVISHVEKRFYILIPISFLVEVGITNLLVAPQSWFLMLSIPMIFQVLAILPVILGKRTVIRDPLLLSLGQTGVKSWIIVVAFSLGVVPLTWLLSQGMSYFLPLYFAAFTLSYQLPGIVFCLKYLDTKTRAATQLRGLTKRENEVAAKMVDGLKYEAIAEGLFISLSAVKKHVYNIYRKLGINNNRELIQKIHESEGPHHF